ncbi:MAG: hypothetical protein MUD01_22315 [Chloroflexaceae bacterium]|nr:hypothetical protein [Chloroflexaceae bacterium]
MARGNGLFSRFRLRPLLRSTLLPLLLYLGLAIVNTWPLVLHFGTAVPGIGYDSWQNMWNMWWLKEALLGGQNPYFTPYLYYPSGVSLLLQTLNPINFVVSLPVHGLFGLVAAYNFVVIFSLTLSGFCTYLLARDVLKQQEPRTENQEPPTQHPSALLRADAGRRTQDAAALLAGVIYATSGYLLSQVYGGHTHMMAAYLLPLALLALRRAEARPTWWRFALAGLVVWLNLWCDWQYLLFAFFWLGWYGLWRVWQARHVRAALPTVITLAIAGGLTLPLAIPTALLVEQTPTLVGQGGPNFRVEQSVDVADYFIPSQLHPLLGGLAAQAQAYKAETDIQSKTVYLGLVALLLALAGLRQRGASLWLGGAIIFGVLALGPQLRFFGAITDIPMPAALLDNVPGLRIFRYPMRFAVLVMLALAVLAALGAARLLQGLAQGKAAWPRAPALLASGLALAIALENLTVQPMVPVLIPPFYAQLAQEPGEFGILEAPFYTRPAAVFLLHQTVHGKGLAGGYTSRLMPYPLLEQFPVVRMFAYARPAPDIIAQDPAEIAPTLFSYFNIRYLTLHSMAGALRYTTLLRVAQAAAGGAEPERVALPDRSFLIYRVAPPPTPVPFLGVGRGWSPPVPSEDLRSATRQIEGEGELVLYNQARQPVSLSITLASDRAGQLVVTADGTALQTLSLNSGEQTVTIAVPTDTVETSLVLRPVDAGAVLVQRVELQ